MKVLERMVQEILPGRQEALEELDKRYDAIEKTLGFPPKRRFWPISGTLSNQMLVLEREWESMAAMETAYEKSFANPGIQALYQEGASIIKNSRIELFYSAD
jgi:hypothetical protein